MIRSEDGLEHGWDRGDVAAWAPVPARRAHEQREAAAAFDRMEQPGWDRADAAEWAKLSEPEVPRIRVWRVVLALVLIVAGGVIGAVGSVPGAVNGATIAMFALGAVGVFMVVREVRR